MAAYNDLILQAQCPGCGVQSQLRFQMHMAASFDGDASGRFCQRAYRLGARLAWWPESDARHAAWIVENYRVAGTTSVSEKCYGGCPKCWADLTAQITYQDLRPVSADKIALVSD